VHEELRRREQADGGKPDAVRVGQPGRDRAEGGDVPADGDGDSDTADRCAIGQW
jgi:hypothetical protein